MRKTSFAAASLWVAIPALFAAQTASAEDLGWRRVLTVGCHNTDNTCFVQVDGPPFGQSLGCSRTPDTEFRFDNGDTPQGRRAYASFLLALNSGAPILVTVDGCTQQGTAKLLHYRVGKG
ncbi:hypothetical protein CDN99_11575 [Roseateles aquatilis]|uniref:Secreted protein n=1 Tax=Roseateles aquatilis TaxID=431061 RepID=A0A246JE04_9BURK|nr:hypothetical protein [Roseateles aquatilis]OWQ90801.1 hypothetical protein CDN99_11575 [Roseateles aquatilis]